MSQDRLAAEIGVTQNTLARWELGTRRPSLGNLEKLARELGCRIADLITEEEDRAGGKDEPILEGVPMRFRAAVQSAERREKMGYKFIVGEYLLLRYRTQFDFWHPGMVFGRELDAYLDQDALDELIRLSGTKGQKKFYTALLEYFVRKFPKCMELIPEERRDDFMHGVLRSIAGYIHAVDFDIPSEEVEDYWKNEVLEDIFRPGEDERFPKAFVEAARGCLKWQGKSDTAKKWVLSGGTVEEDYP